MKAVSKTTNPPPARAAAEQGPSEPQLQLEAFNRAMEAFHQRDFKRAQELFETASKGPAREVAFSARQHMNMCEQRLAKANVQFESPEDYYAYATTLVNRQQYSEAIPYLQKALEAHEADHYHYAMALCQGQSGHIDAAVRHLARAIDLSPRNRGLASTDADFTELLKQPQIRELLQSDK